MKAEFSEGICQHGAAILRDGQPLTISEILASLRQGAEAQKRISELEAGLDDAIEINNAHAEREEVYLKRIRALKTALRMVLDDPESLSGRPRTAEVVREALEPPR